MDPGDAITHVFTPNSGSTLDEDGRILPEVLAAQQRGGLIDTANDGNNVGWGAAEMTMSQGLLVPALTVKSVRVIESGAGLYPWGWAPPVVTEPGVAV